MRSSLKKQLIEMVEYVDFPMGIYVYETGKLIANNRLAKQVFHGASCVNINLLWSDHKKLKLSPEVLAGKSQMFFEREVMIEDEICYLDFEINVIPLQNEHIVVAFLDLSYRQSFRADQMMLLPRFLWFNNKKELVSYNTAIKKNVLRYMELKSHPELITASDQIKLDEIHRQIDMFYEEKKPAYCTVEQLDVDTENSGFTTDNKVPFLGKQEEMLGLMVISMPAISDGDYKRLFTSARFENMILRECVENENKLLLAVDDVENMRLRYASGDIKLLGYTQEQIAMGEVCWSELIHPDDRERVNGEIEDAFQRRERFFQQKYRIIDGNDRELWIDVVCSGYEFKENDENVYMVVRPCNQEFLARGKQRAVMKQETYLDFLTGLPNRLKYEDDAEMLIEAAIASKKKGYIIVIDLDDFRCINEGIGPEYGDALLKMVSKSLNDIPEVENYCYRIDGDEFLLFVRSEYCKQIESIIQSCLQLFQSSWQIEGKECYCTVSVGIAEYPKDSAQARELLKHADAAVYEAKRKGKNRIQHYKKAVLKNSEERVNYEKYLRKAIAKGCVEFELYYQPIVLTQTKKLVASEALVRWYSPELGFITPVNFISLSEYLGLIVPLGEYVLRESFQRCKQWNDLYDPDFMVSVNLSVVQLVQQNIVDRIEEIARTTGVNPANIILEVTESLAVEDMDLMKSVLERLKAYGFKIALDDFGTGYSSLNHIMRMPLDYVKIDQSFVSCYGTERFNPSLLSAITELAHSVGMEVVVEGVETKQQMEFLMFLNSDRIQGYLYGKPMPATEFEATFLKKKK